MRVCTEPGQCAIGAIGRRALTACARTARAHEEPPPVEAVYLMKPCLRFWKYAAPTIVMTPPTVMNAVQPATTCLANGGWNVFCGRENAICERARDDV